MEIMKGGRGKTTQVDYVYICPTNDKNKKVAAYSLDSWNKVGNFTKFVCWILGKTTEVEANINGKQEKFVVIKGSFRQTFGGGMFITDKQVCEQLAKLTNKQIHAPTSSKDLLKIRDTKAEMDKHHVPKAKQDEVLDTLNKDKLPNPNQLPVDHSQIEEEKHNIEEEEASATPPSTPPQSRLAEATREGSPMRGASPERSAHTTPASSRPASPARQGSHMPSDASSWGAQSPSSSRAASPARSESPKHAASAKSAQKAPTIMSAAHQRLNDAHPKKSIEWDNPTHAKRGMWEAYSHAKDKKAVKQDIEELGYKVNERMSEVSKPRKK